MLECVPRACVGIQFGTWHEIFCRLLDWHTRLRREEALGEVNTAVRLIRRSKKKG
jgi:hypothetical protein